MPVPFPSWLLRSLLLAGALTSGRHALGLEAISQHGITWQLAGGGHVRGTFANGDPWVVGPVTVVGIGNSLNSPAYTARRGQNGSMVNPLVGHDPSLQGYDDGLVTYRESLNAALISGLPVSPSNPLVLQPGQTLVSMVSWLYRSAGDREPGCPEFNAGTNTPRPATRSAGILTVLEAAPPPGAFRPPYAGADKTIRHRVADLRTDLLLRLPPPPATPNLATLAAAFSRTWVDHGYEFLGAMFHPSEHMPNYGRDMAHLAVSAALLLHVDTTALPGSPDKLALLVPFVQYGLDSAGIADAGGGWPANGGHHGGRFWPILFAGLMLDDAHLQAVGTWGRHRGRGFQSADAGLTEFQEYQQHFTITQAEVDISNSPSWNPDPRGSRIRYQPADIGQPEWGIRHSFDPARSDAALDTPYRDINGSSNPGFALAARLMGAQGLWNHDPFFDYADRAMALTGGGSASNPLPLFARQMWQAYAADYDVVSFNDFQRSRFTPAQLAQPAVSGPLARTPGSLLTLLEQHYFGLSGGGAGALLEPIAPPTGGWLRLRHLTRVRPPNGRVIWERSADLESWTAVLPASQRVTSAGAERFMVEADFPASGTTPAFIRLRLLP